MDDRLTGWLILAAAALSAAAGGARAQPAPEAAPLAPPADGPLPAHFSYFAPSSGWFVETEADVVRPRITALRSDDWSTFLFDPSARAMDLDWGSAGEVSVGCRAANASGFQLSIRGGSWTGHKTVALTGYSIVGSWGFSEATPENLPTWEHHTRDLHTRLSFARLDLDYLGSGWAVGDSARLGWSMGIRAAWMGLVATADDSFSVPLTNPATGFPVGQQTTPGWGHERATLALGAGGVHFALDATWALWDSGWGLFARLDGGLLGAAATERYSSWTRVDGGTLLPDGADQSGGLLATLNATAGVQNVIPCRYATLRLGAGYQFEAWWFATANLNLYGGGSMDLVKGLDWQSHGLFVRGVFEF